MQEKAFTETDYFTDLVRKFGKRKIVIVGDLVADRFLYGAISRVSREAPVFILRHEQTSTVPGGAANAAMNVAALGAESILVGVVGADTPGRELIEKLKEAGVETRFLIQSENWQTTTKTRILAGQPHAPRQQVIRIDYENESAISEELKSSIKNNLREAVQDSDAVIISDYNYGVADRSVFEVLKNAREIPFFVDSRFRLADFAGATSATPNEDEIEEIVGERFKDLSGLEEACRNLREKMDLQALLVTRGKNGMMLIEKGKPPFHSPAVGSLDAVDVTGAGDTVMAAYALALASGASFQQAAEIANYAGGIVVMKRGTATASQNELIDLLLQIKSRNHF